MSSQSPPNPNVNTYNSLYWISGDGFITENFANKHYLKFPQAQGTETMKNTIFNGTIVANSPATFNDYVDITGGQSINFENSANALSGSIFGFTSGGNNNLYVSNPSTGYVIVKSNNVNTATFGSTQSTFSTSVGINNTLTMNGTINTDRIINSVYYQLQDNSSLTTTTGQIYANSGVFIYDNNVDGGSHTFATNNTSGVQTIPLNFSSANMTITTTNPPTSSATQPASNDSSTKMPTTAWVQTAVSGGSSSLLASNNSWTGTNSFSNTFSLTNVNPPTSTATQPVATDASNKMPTNAWVQSAITSNRTNLLASNNNWTGTNTFNALVSAVANLRFTSATATNREIQNVGYITYLDTGGGVATTTEYQNGNFFTIDNNASTNGTISFALNNSGSAQVNPLVMNALTTTISGQVGSTNLPACKIEDSLSGKFFGHYPSTIAGNFNPMITVGQSALLALATTVNNSSLFLGVWSNVSAGISCAYNNVVMGAGGNAPTPSSYIAVQGATNQIELVSVNPPTSNATQPAFSDSSTKMPTTAWVQGAITASAPTPSSFVPTGAVMSWVGNTTAPSGWLFCNGAALSTTTYATLFAVLGYTYGGSGASFLLPDMFSGTGDGTMAVCSSTVSNTGVVLAPSATPVMSGGNQTISATQLPAHQHNITYSSGTNFVQSLNTSSNTTTGGSSNRVVGSTNGGLPSITGTQAGTTGSDYLPPFVAFTYIIKT